MRATRPTALDDLLRSLPTSDADGLRRWLGDSGTSMLGNHEPVVELLPRPRAGDPQAIRSVGVIGGGTAGYLTALALRTKRPWLDVSLVESPTIPIIGVGEATVPGILAFLHHYLGIDPAELYEQVRPTWKLGIHFDWGPHPDGFMAPFDWNSNSVGMVGSIRSTGNIDAATVQSLLMRSDRTPVFDVDGQPVSLMKHLPFAYHLDNARFVAYLQNLAKQRGVRHVEAEVDEVVLGGDNWVDHLKASGDRKLQFDFYVDCTGFRSMLLGKAMKTPFQDFQSSLFTDSAVVGNIDHGGHLKPYTSAITMESGWCWSIPTPEDDHLGYVYSSSAISHNDAADELRRRFPGVGDTRVVRFRVGRHAEAWRGNVMGIGNSYAFVEPLESTGLLMITESILGLVAALPGSWADAQVRDAINTSIADRWDALRWFLSIHYRFNTRLDTEFWKHVRSNTDISGAQGTLDMFASGAPLRLRNPILKTYAQANAPIFYGLAGVDTLLLGQQVPTRLLHTAEPVEQWQARKSAADALVRRALPHREALELFHSTPRLLQELFTDDDSWASRAKAASVGMA